MALNFMAPVVIDGNSLVTLEKEDPEEYTKKLNKLYLHDEGFYITPTIDFQKDFPTTVPLWVRLYNLPLNCRGTISLSKMLADWENLYLWKNEHPNEIMIIDLEGRTITQPAT
ncbi:hypothetical protein H5410_005216 [Solanum commersonii]|uniref:DUF4283 domain-containing protein n=1 Tax=Solanum commersonii TaxID=4109 RepID=A0A9J6A5T3_SOLCO|nr:hypothetical protein H5410_005216 [Solanum commersonii]